MAAVQDLLLDGISTGDLNKVKKAIAAGAVINTLTYSFKFYCDMTPLEIACSEGHNKIADYLISKGADFFLIKHPGKFLSQLYEDSECKDDNLDDKRKNKKVFNYAITNMKHLNEPDGNGDTPFSRIVQTNDLNAVKYLVETMNANVCRKGLDKGDSPLVKATKNNNLDMIKYLLEKGASPSIGSALDCALKNGYLEIAEFFIKKRINLDQKCDGNTFLIKAVEERYEEIIDLLIERGANLNCTSAVGKTALSTSIALNFQSITKKLIANGANVNIADPDGKTPLIKIVENSNFVLCKLAVEAGAKIGETEGINALKIAAGNGDLLITIYLIEHCSHSVITGAMKEIENFVVNDIDFANFWEMYRNNNEDGNSGNCLEQTSLDGKHQEQE